MLRVFGVGHDSTSFGMDLYSTELGASTITVTIVDAINGQAVQTLCSFGHSLALGVQNVQLCPPPNFSASPLSAGGSYKATVNVTATVGPKTFSDSKSVFFTVSSINLGQAGKAVAVPEIDFLVLPLLLFGVLSLLLKKQAN